MSDDRPAESETTVALPLDEIGPVCLEAGERLRARAAGDILADLLYHAGAELQRRRRLLAEQESAREAAEASCRVLCDQVAARDAELRRAGARQAELQAEIAALQWRLARAGGEAAA